MYKIIGADGNEYGPITAEQVRQWIAEGRLNGVSRIQPDGFAEWRELREIAEFSSHFGPSPGAPPPISLGSTPSVPYHATMPTNVLAGWALGTGIASLPCCCLPIFSPVSIVLGAIALSQLNQNPNQGGRSLAIAGIILGCIGLVMAIICWAIFLSSSPDLSQFRNLGR